MSLGYWDQQFQISKVLPDFKSILDRMGEQSAQVNLSFDQMSYGPDPRQFVEINGTPSRNEVLPVFIHGGYWRALNAQSHRFVLPALRAQTGAVANVEYRLLPHVSLKEIVADVVTAFEMLAETFGCRLALIGHSAGGHLAFMAAHQQQTKVVCATAISGLLDVIPLQWSFLRDEVGLTEDDLIGQNPLENWQGRDASHLLVAVGESETAEFHRQAQMFAAVHSVSRIEIPDAHHMSVLDDLADPSGTLIPKIHTMIQNSAMI